MKIIEFKSSNIKRLKAVELKLDDKKNLVMITGKNAQGKSSILDSIWYALGGKKVMPGKPIRDGEESAEVELNLEGYIVKRTFTDKGSYLVVTNKDGSKYSNPQEFLDYIVANLAFDPLEFTRLEPDKQVKTLAKTVGLDLTGFDQKRKELTQERVMVGREMKAVSKYTPEQVDQAKKDLAENANLPSIQSAMDQYQAASAEMLGHERRQERLKQIDLEIDRLNKEKDELLKASKPAHDLQKMKADLDALQGKLDKVKTAERIIAENKVVEDKQVAYDKLTADIEAVDASKAAKLAEAKMPVAGLSWTEDAVLYNGIPYNQISAAEQLRVSMAIAMATNPKLRVILIRDGSLLDSTNLKTIEEMAKEEDFQVWIESVDETGKVGVYIEDGEIKAIND